MVDTSFVSATLYHKGLGKSIGMVKVFRGSGGIFSEFRLYAVVNERGSSVIAFHLLPHSETGFTGQREWNLQNVYNFMQLYGCESPF